MSRLRLAAVALGLAVALGAGQAEAQTSTPQQQQQPAANPLAALVVPRAQLGRAAAGLQIELTSGSTTNARAADDSFDQNDTANTLGALGRAVGFTLLYGDVGLSALRAGKGQIDLGSSIDLFKSAAHAAAYEKKTLRDLQQVRGKNLNGVVIERSSTFNVSGLGPGATGLRIVQRIGNKRIYSTYVDFQIDRLLCEAIVNRADANNVNGQAISIARTLAGRIIAYAQNSLNAQPVRLPRPLGLRQPGKKAPKLDTMVLTNADLKGKGGVFQQGFAADDNAIASYQREFRFAPSSGLFQLRTTAALERSAREAAGRLLVLRSIFTGPEGAATLAQLIAPGATAVKREEVRGLGLGDESFAVSVSFTSQGQRFRVIAMHERRQRVSASMILVGAAKKLTAGGIVPYAQAQDKRIKSGLKPQLVA
ncbi:MAG TPA: hypothetical protein VJT84_15195 [Gaiellaceae bacterium]|nr:hypothetical protein [Gaiellaceae bacterium]